MDALVQVQVPFPTSTASLDSSTTSSSTDNLTARTSVEAIKSRWTNWFKQQPDITVPPAPENDFVDSLISSSLSGEHSCDGKDTLLKLAFTPTKNDMLNSAQLRILYSFVDVIETPKDAFGDFFRLLLLYFDPSLALKLDAAYNGWEDTICTLVVDPASYLDSAQLWALLEPLQGYQQRSVLWILLWLVHTLSLHSSSPLSPSFDVFIPFRFSM